MLNLSVATDIRRMRVKMAEANDAICNKAVSRALNKLATEIIAQSAREIRTAGYGFKLKDIKSKFKARKATPQRRQIVIRCFHRAVPLIEFGARQVAAGVSVKVKGSRKVVRGAFIAKTPSGHVGVFKRDNSAKHKRVLKGGRVVWSALPINQLYGPSAAVAFANATVMNVIERYVESRYPVLLEHEIKYARSRFKA
ncbi:phage tail protein [Methylobacillus flagellatus]|nr:phage tail protein [Methylobacillus flagellatus]